MRPRERTLRHRSPSGSDGTTRISGLLAFQGDVTFFSVRGRLWNARSPIKRAEGAAAAREPGAGMTGREGP